MGESNELRVSIPEQVLFRDLDGESVLLHTESGQYFGLDEVGTLIWSRIAEGDSLSLIEETILEEYDVVAERAHDDLMRIVEELCANGLLVAVDE